MRNTNARTHARRKASARTHMTPRTTIVLFMFADPSSVPSVDHRPSTSPPHRRCNKYKVHRRHCHRRRRRDMVLIRGPITDARGSIMCTRGEIFRRRIISVGKSFSRESLSHSLRRKNNNIRVTTTICGHPIFRAYL